MSPAWCFLFASAHWHFKMLDVSRSRFQKTQMAMYTTRLCANSVKGTKRRNIRSEVSPKDETKEHCETDYLIFKKFPTLKLVILII